MNKTGWIVFCVVIVGLLGGLVAWTRISNPPIDVSGVNTNAVLAASDQSGSIADHSRGESAKKVILIEYGDFQCPSCAGASPNVNTLVNEYSSKVIFVFRNFPLTTIHPNARAAAAVAEAAGKQGKFWEMHDMLYDKQTSWESLDTTKRNDAFNSYAQSLGLNMDTFATDLASSSVSQKISFDQALGKKIGVNATPTFILNGTELESATASGIVQGDLTAIRAKLDELLK